MKRFLSSIGFALLTTFIVFLFAIRLTAQEQDTRVRANPVSFYTPGDSEPYLTIYQLVSPNRGRFPTDYWFPSNTLIQTHRAPVIRQVDDHTWEVTFKP